MSVLLGRGRRRALSEHGDAVRVDGEEATGDVVAILQSGAYGLSASPVGFLSHPMPAEVLVRGGEARLIRPAGAFSAPLVNPPT